MTPPVAEVPSVAVSAPIRVQARVAAASVARQAPGLATAPVRGFRGAAALARWKLAVDELPIVEAGHNQIVLGRHDTSAVAIRGCPARITPSWRSGSCPHWDAQRPCWR